MKKIYLIIVLHSFCTDIYAHIGMIVGLEAPLLQYPNLKSKVLQMKRKGQKLYIAPDPRISISPLEVDYNVGQFGKRITYVFDKEMKFYHTLTRNGVDAYIPVNDVKLIHGDSRELENKIISTRNDPRDYRLEEPLPRFFPFSKEKHKRVSFLYTHSNAAASFYNYENSVTNESYGQTQGLTVNWGSKVSFDSTDRFYFGGSFSFSNSSSLFEFGNDLQSAEKHRVLTLGPYASFDVLRTHRYMINFGVGMSFNYILNLVTLTQESSGSEESRQFTGYSLSAGLHTNFVIRDIIPNTGTDFVIGLRSTLMTPYSLNATTLPQETNLWSETDAVLSPIESQLSIIIGLQARY